VCVNREPAAVIPPNKYPMIHRAVLAACDANDGVRDGVIEDPARCRFDFATLACAADDRADCLTRPQIETAKAMSSPIADPKSGAVLHPGRYYPGSELGWGGVGGPVPSGESLEGMKKIVFTPNWDYHIIRVPDDVERAVKADNGLLYGGEPNLTPILDMVFQLITFFMLVINFQAAAVDMSLKLPVVGSARLTPPDRCGGSSAPGLLRLRG
jgi:feruloyl esterase